MANGKDLVPVGDLNVAALSGDGESMELLREALAGEQLSLGDFERVVWPSGNGPFKFTRTVLGNEEAVESISGIIVHQGMSRAYWDNPDPVPGTPPDCKSPDAKFGYGNPGDDLRAQTPPQGCEVCPHSAWASSPKEGSQAQACKLTRDLFILPTGGGLLPLLLSIPPGSLPGGKSYVVELAGFGIRYYHAVTEVALERATSKGGQAFAKAKFRMAGLLDDEGKEKIEGYRRMLAPTFERATPAAGEADAVDADAEPDEG